MSPKAQRKRALFLDRDGVINVDKGYVHRPEDVDFVEGVFKLTEHFQRHDYRIFVVSNQAGIARGYYSKADFQKLSAWMMSEFRRRGIEIVATYYCPHHPEAGVGSLKTWCGCRKPNPGMILQAAKEHGLDLSLSVLVGNRETDIEAGKRAGVGTTILLRDERCMADETEADFEVQRLSHIPSLSAGKRSGGSPGASDAPGSDSTKGKLLGGAGLRRLLLPGPIVPTDRSN